MNLPCSTSAHLGSDFLHQTCHVHLGSDEKVPLILGLKVKKNKRHGKLSLSPSSPMLPSNLTQSAMASALGPQG
jgi:hypothetical protein